MERGPVFVAGAERSGTTLLYALLASHPGIAMTRRTNLWTYFYEQYGDLGDPANLDRCIDAMTHYKRLVRIGFDPARLRRDFMAGQASYGRLFALFEQQYAERLERPRWGDKSLGTERYAGAIFAAYPDARVLHMLRDPRDRYASVQTRWRGRRGGVGAGVAEWLASARLAERNGARYPERYRVVRYEDLAACPAGTLRDICSFIGEPYTPRMLRMDGAGTFRAQGSNSSYREREPGVIGADSIGRFRSVLSARQIAFVQAVAGRRMRRFGYEPAAVDLRGGEWLPFLVRDLPREGGRLVAWSVRERYRDGAGRPLPAYRLVGREAAA